jgi:hypothetical protein
MNDADHISRHVQEVVDKLTTEQAFHIWSCKRARENAELLPPLLEWETRERTPQERAYAFAQWGRSIGASEAAIGCEMTRALLERGYSDEDAAELLQDVGVVWSRRKAA